MFEPIRVQPALTPDEYLEAELAAEFRHEYVGGYVYLRPECDRRHNVLTVNLTGLLGQHLRDHPCEVLGSQMKLRPAVDVFYYPDLMVCCERAADDSYHTEEARYVFEVVSASTRRVDEVEKARTYWGLPSIEAYVLVAQDVLWVRVLRRGADGWETEHLTRPDDLLRLDSLGFAAPLSAVYDRTGVPSE